MRVIAGSRRGIPLKSIPGTLTRPTSDKVKESIFNMIGPYLDGGIVVELFGGSGSLSIEALSRGAEQAFIFEKNTKAIAVIRENIEKCRLTDHVQVLKADARSAAKYLNGQPQIDYLFVDPPYAEEKYYNLVAEIAEAGLLSEQAIIICEHDKKVLLPETYHQFTKTKYREYGHTAISIFEK